MTSLQVIFFTYLLVVCSSFQSLHFASAVPYNRSLAAVQNMLSYYGVNASNFANGQLLCPPCSSSDSCNKSDIHIGVLGSIIDPFMAVLTPEERTFLETQTEGECMVGTPVYYPPAAGELHLGNTCGSVTFTRMYACTHACVFIYYYTFEGMH